MRAACLRRAAPLARQHQAAPCGASVRRTASAAAARGAALPHGLELLHGATLEERTAQLGWHGVSPLVDDSRFLAPRRASYSAGGARRSWDLVESMPSVAVLLYHRERRAALLVRQFRPPVYAAAAARAREGAPPPPLDAGFTYELCAGLRDKAGLSAEAVAIEEVREEVGYEVDSLELVSTHLEAIGISGPSQELFFGVVGEADRIDGGGGGLAGDGEAIDVLSLPMENALAFATDAAFPKAAGLQFALAVLPQLLKRRGLA